MKAFLLFICLNILCSFNLLNAQEEVSDGFLFPRFEKGIVTYKNGTRTAAMLNYSMLNEEMLFLAPDSTIMAIANPEEILLVIINDRRFFPAGKDIFYEAIQAGEGSFYIHRKAIILSKGKGSGYGGHSQTSAIGSIEGVYSPSGQYKRINSDEKYNMKIDHFYYLKPKSDFKKFGSAKTLGKLFKGHEAEIEKFADEQSINFSKIEDITRIVGYGYELSVKK